MSQGSTSNLIKGTYSGSVSKPIQVDESGSLFTLPNQKVSILNTTTTPLIANESFTGSAELNTYQDVMVSCKCDTSATLFFDFSNDGENWDSFPSAGFTVSANIHEFHTAVKGPRLFRVRLLNTSEVGQTYLRLYTYYGTYRQPNLPINQSISSDADAALTKGVIVGETDGGLFVNVPVTPEGHLEVAVHSPILPFGSIHCERLTPIFQTDSVYGINKEQIISTTGSSGVATTTSSMFSVSTGTTIYSQASLQSRKRLRYRPGQGVVGRCTGLFTAPVNNSYQLIGFGHAEDGIYIGYSGSSFGILHTSFGVREQQLLTVLSSSLTNQSVVVTLGGVTSSVAITNANNITRTAYEISQGSFSGWKAEPTGSQVLFTADSAGNKTGTFSLSGSLTTGSFTEIQAGLSETQVFVSQSEWNGDKLNGRGSSGVELIPTNGNVYQFGIQYLGFGAINVDAEVVPPGGNNASFVTLHTFTFPNSRTRPTFGNPSLPFTMAAYSAGSTTDLSVRAGSFAGFIEGEKRLNGNQFSYKNTATSISTTVWQPLFTIANSRRYGGRANQSVVNVLSFGFACKLNTAGAGEFLLIKNGTLSGSGAPFFARYDDASCTLFDTSSASVTYRENSQVLFSLPVSENTQGTFTFTEDLDIQPGESLTVACRLSAGSSTYANATINTREDQ